MSVTTAREARLATKAAAARLLVRLLAEHDVTQDELARACGVGHSLAQKWADRDRLETPSIADVLAMPQPIALGLLRWAAESHGHALAVLPVDESQAEQLEHLAATVRECGEASARFALSIADGTIAPAEAVDLEREATEAIECLVSVRDRARAALPQRGPRRIA